MRLTRPSNALFIISVVLAILALLVFFGTLTLEISPFWIMTAAFGVLTVGVLAND